MSRLVAMLLAAALLASCADKPTTRDKPAAGQVVTQQGSVEVIPGEEPPPAPREFRAAWVATVANIDWPSRRDLTTAQQREEIVAIVERARAMNLNALIVQVRPSADAIYPSALEPWSEYLTGEQGRPPQPYYDPLQAWIEEAHRRGIEIHAWFNPYRARHAKAQGREAATHISRTRPALVKAYGEYLWLDPGEPAAAQHTLDVILDVVRRYDIDGVHIDDYFYPYPVTRKAADGTEAEVDFPDEPSWRAYQRTGGALSRADWRRRNVNTLVERIYDGVHRAKPWVRFGVSPFGIGRPDRRPPGIAGFSQYDKLYADVEWWLRRCWVDYLSPQLYWPLGQAAQDFGVLLDYWIGENTCGRHIYPGLFTSRIDGSEKSWSVAEIANQIAVSRTRVGSSGQIHFSMAALVQNRAGVADALAASQYAVPALIPAATWIDSSRPEAPDVVVWRSGEGRITVQLKARGGKPVARYAVWDRLGGAWRFTVVPGSTGSLELVVPAKAGTQSLDSRLRGNDAAGAKDTIVVSAVDRLGNESPRVASAPFAIIPASEWGATPADATKARRHTINRITLHHQGVAYPPGRDPREYLRSLQKWSRETKGWIDIPYHYVVDTEGRVYEARDIAYAGDTNTEYDPAGHALVEVVGNFDEIEPNAAQLEAVARVMALLAARHGLDERAIAAHRDYSTNTTCPGRNLYRYIENGWFRDRVRESLAQGKRR